MFVVIVYIYSPNCGVNFKLIHFANKYTIGHYFWMFVFCISTMEKHIYASVTYNYMNKGERLMKFNCFSRKPANPLNNFTEQELKEECARLTAKLTLVSKEIRGLEHKKTEAFNNAVGKDTLTKRLVVHEIEGYESERKLKYNNFVQMDKRLLLTRNLLILKQHETDLAKSDVWRKITQLNQEELITRITRITLTNKSVTEIIDSLNTVIDTGIMSDDSIRDPAHSLFEAWTAVEQGAEVNLDDYLVTEKEGTKQPKQEEVTEWY